MKQTFDTWRPFEIQKKYIPDTDEKSLKFKCSFDSETLVLYCGYINKSTGEKEGRGVYLSPEYMMEGYFKKNKSDGFCRILFSNGGIY